MRAGAAARRRHLDDCEARDLRPRRVRRQQQHRFVGEGRRVRGESVQERAPDARDGAVAETRAIERDVHAITSRSDTSRASAQAQSVPAEGRGPFTAGEAQAFPQLLVAQARSTASASAAAFVTDRNFNRT